jgi:hypothetical protein
MGLEQADQLVAGQYRLAGQNPPLGLGDDPLDQRPIVADLRLVHQRRRDRAVQPHHATAFQFLLLGAGEQRAIDLLPGLGADRANRLVQHRLLRAPRVRQPGERPKRRRVLQMERQLLVAQLAVLLEHRTAQHALRRQAAAAGLL